MILFLQSKLFLSKKFCFKQDFETRSRLPINFYIMAHLFNMYIIISMYIRSYFRVELLTFAEWRATLMVTC